MVGNSDHVTHSNLSYLSCRSIINSHMFAIHKYDILSRGARSYNTIHGFTKEKASTFRIKYILILVAGVKIYFSFCLIESITIQAISIMMILLKVMRNCINKVVQLKMCITGVIEQKMPKENQMNCLNCWVDNKQWWSHRWDAMPLGLLGYWKCLSRLYISILFHSIPWYAVFTRKAKFIISRNDINNTFQIP